MDEFEKIQEIVKKFNNEAKNIKKEISDIEKTRTSLAQERNRAKNDVFNADIEKINILGDQISKLGNQSQELQNKLNSKFNEIKNEIGFKIDNLIAEKIRKIRQVEEEREELVEEIIAQENKNIKYEMQKQEFFERFHRMPELSKQAKIENEIQEKKYMVNKIRVQRIERTEDQAEIELESLARAKRNLKNGNLESILKSEQISKQIDVVEEIEKNEEASFDETVVAIENIEQVEQEKNEEESFELPLTVENMDVEELYVEEFEPIEELKIEPFEEIEEFESEEFKPEKFEVEEYKENVEEQEVQKLENNNVDDKERKLLSEIEKIAKAIVEEIAEKQTQDIQKVEENNEKEIITFEEEEEQKIEVKEKPVLVNIIAKFEDGEIVYKAQTSNGDEIKIYPKNISNENILLKTKKDKETIKAILTDYASAEGKLFDEDTVDKIDTSVCEVFTEFANKYNYDLRELMYNYAMTFLGYQEGKPEEVPEITYNLAYIEKANLTKKEKKIIEKICKDARYSNRTDIIGCITLFSKLKYILKRIFAVNSTKGLPEGKY